MENFFARYKNPLVLMAVLFIQVVALATQVKRPENPRAGSGGGGTRLIRVWTVTAFTPVQKLFVSSGHFFRDSWSSYADLRNVRRQNRELQEENERLRMEQVRLRQDADQAHRLQTLLEFKEKFVAKTLAAQVIATSGTEQSRVITVDKGAHSGVKNDMAVITPDGIVGKVKEVFPLSSQVLLINDHDSGAGVILESSRLQGVLKGTGVGELQITDIMSDEKIEAGEHVITSGGDRIFPKGISVGTVISASPDRENDPFMNIRIKPAADLRRLEEVLIVMKTAEETPAVATGSTPVRAADILSQRLPSIPKVDPNAPKTALPGAAASPASTPTAAPNKPAGAAEPNPTGAAEHKEAGAVNAGSVKPPAAAAQPSPAGAARVSATGEAGAGSKPATGAKPSPTPGKTAAAGSQAPVSGQASGQTSGQTASKPTAAGATATPKPEKKSGGTTGATSQGTTSAGANHPPAPASTSATGGAGQKSPASSTTSSGSAAGGSPTATPTPKPKAPAKKKAPASPEATPGAPDKTTQPETGAAPTPTPARLP